MTSSLKGNFVVSQSDLWDTHTLSHAKQRQSPRGQSRCPDHSHPPPQQQQQQIQQQPQQTQYDHERENSTAASPAPIQRSVSEKNRTKHRHKQKSTACQSETDSEREQRDYQNFPSSVCSTGSTVGVTSVAASCVTPTKISSRKLSKSQHSHHHSTPNVAPEKKHSGGGAGVTGGSTHIRHRKKESSSKPNLYGACSESELLDGDTAILPIFRKLLNEKDSRYRTRNTVGASCPNISIKCDIVEYL